jgi:hypothetical protein
MLYGYLFGYKKDDNVDVDEKAIDLDNFELNSESELGSHSDNDSIDQEINSIDQKINSGDQKINSGDQEITKEYYYFEHLEHVKESYWVHFKHSMTYAFLAAKCTFFFIVHAFWPDVFQTSGSDTIFRLTNKMTKRDE